MQTEVKDIRVLVESFEQGCHHCQTPRVPARRMQFQVWLGGVALVHCPLSRSNFAVIESGALASDSYGVSYSR
jgi:hypothetical protein